MPRQKKELETEERNHGIIGRFEQHVCTRDTAGQELEFDKSNLQSSMHGTPLSHRAYGKTWHGSRVQGPATSEPK